MKCLSLYSGCGGLDLGFHDAGFTVVWSNELSPMAHETYKGELTRRGSSLPQFATGDISSSELPERGAADVVMGGPPCQGFSVAGKMNPEDPRSRHVWEFFRVVEHIRPKAFVMENVMALGKNQRWKSTRQALLAKGESLGFSTTLLLLNAADYGVPQQRERMFIVGVRGGSMPTPPPLEKRISVREALAGIPAYGAPGNDSLCKAIITPAKSPVLRKSPFAGMLFNGQGRPIDLEQAAPTLPASMGGNRTPIIDQKCLAKGAEHWIIGYHEQLMKGGPIATEIPERLRRLTVEEAAHLQGFPVGMRFSGSQCAKFTQIGNSVPPPLGKAVGKSLMSALGTSEATYQYKDDQLCWVAEDGDYHVGANH